MPIQLQADRFNNLRRHIHKKPRTGLHPTNGVEVYNIKRKSRVNRENFIKNSQEAKDFFNWIFTIQISLKLTTRQFINRINKLGGKASIQTLSLWRRQRGHIPCDRNYKALLKLEREANLIHLEIKNIVKETTSKLILK